MAYSQNFGAPPSPGTAAHIIGESLGMTGDTESFVSIRVTVLLVFPVEYPDFEDWGAMVRMDSGDQSGEMKTVLSCDLYMDMQ